MNREYELGLIIPSNVPESETPMVLDQVKQWIESFGGKILNTDFWGRRRLAYPIQDFREGFYVFITMEYPTQQIAELENNLRLYDRVIRHLVVRLDE